MYTYSFVFEDDWNTGFVANLIIKNISEKPMAWSQQEFKAPFKISNLWTGKKLSESDQNYVVEMLIGIVFCAKQSDFYWG